MNDGVHSVQKEQAYKSSRNKYVCKSPKDFEPSWP